MNDLPRHTLARVIAEHGRGICDAPKRVEALLRDLCGAYRREINIIMGALEERVAADLIAASAAVPRAALLARLAARLRDNLAYTPEAARWAVETWAFALGVLSEAEFQARARAESATETAAAQRSAAPPPVREPKPSAVNKPTVTPHAPQPQRDATFSPPLPPPAPPPTPPPQTKTAPPPIIQRPTAPPPRRMTASPPKVAAPVPRQSASPTLSEPPFTRRRGLTLRGCFITVVLVIVLIVAAIFAVPAVIMLLQDEQARPSINDPRIP